MPDTKAIFFDAGGTLIEGQMPLLELYGAALRLAGHPVPAVRIVEAYEAAIRAMLADKRAADETAATPVRDLNEYLAGTLGLRDRRLQQAVDEVLFDHPEARHLVCAPGTEQVLAALQARGYRLAVLSNWSVDLPTLLSQLGLRPYLEAVFTSEALGYTKPDPAAFLAALERMDLAPGETAYVGDLYDVDVVGARRAGLRPILLDRAGVGLHPEVRTVTTLAGLLDHFPGP